MFPGIAVISPAAKLPFSPGMNHADAKRLCFRNPAEFTARPSLLLTCVWPKLPCEHVQSSVGTWLTSSWPTSDQENESTYMGFEVGVD
ncbi:hypothetical protein DV515_00007841 [Chloebia gouldiae]|uniref:Uncharacterized protein n=1 Tax=Chloebia gouldiae TaxID=44316 RepID=A0A3L8SGA4_CHLGU|nr:hypothetical protein DV515_00007841 [Chloebia gouldiae]